MKAFIYNLLSKGLLLVLLLAIAAMYHYRAELFPRWSAAQPVVEEPQSAGTVSAAPESPEQAAGPVESPVISSESEVSAPAAETPADVEPQQAPSQEAAAENAPVAIEAPEITAVELRTAAQADEPVVADIARARQAYWQGDMESSVSAYQAVIVANPDSADAFGELGNLYFSQGNWDAASQAYLDAGQRLIAQGQPQAAAHLLRVLRGLNPARAEQLARAMARAEGDIPR